jgi:biotin carboxylase
MVYKEIIQMNNNMVKVILISSGYYLLEEYMQLNDNIYVLLTCDPQYCPDEIKNNSKIFFTLDYSKENLIREIQKINIKFDYLLCIDDKFLDRINEIKEMIGVKSFQISGDIARDKSVLKEYMKINNILYPATISFDSIKQIEEYKAQINYPSIIKPSNSYGSNGVYLIENFQELKNFSSIINKYNIFQKKFYGDSRGKILLEEYIDGEEYAVDIIWNNGVPICELVSSRLHVKEGNMFPDYVYFIDCNMEEEKRKVICNLAERVGEIIEITNGATHTELREKNGRYYVLENAVRPGGGGCMYQLHRYMTEVNYFNQYYQSMTGNKIEKVNIIKNMTGKFIFFLSYANTKSGIVTKIEFNRNQLGSNTEIFKVDFLTHIGDRILPNTKGMRYTIFVFGIVHTESLREFEREIDKVNSACILEVI